MIKLTEAEFSRKETVIACFHYLSPLRESLMSDYSEFCKAYNGSSSDPDFMDNWLKMYADDADASRTETLQKRTMQEHNLSENEISQIMSYAALFRENSFTKLHEINNYLSKHNRWGEFTAIRSYNDHGSHKRVPGIIPKFYKVVCQVLERNGGVGAPLIKSEKY